jgi:hypothetical protein
MIKLDGKLVGERFDGLARAEHDLSALLEHLHHRADANRYKEGNDENRYGAPQQWLGAQQPPIRRLCN